ncbi:MAG: hypothetical protein IJ524_05640 [Bacteroidales bacterium]|nr:hypothetical protein [Bacteroidales bacterium]
MRLCVFNPEHDLCLAKGRAHYVPPRSAVDFARRDAKAVMGVLYPDAVCSSVYDLELSTLHFPLSTLTVWGWDAVVKHELGKRGVPESLLPSDEEIATIRELQHRSTVLPLQEDCHEVHGVEEMEALLRQREHWVLKAPWSGAGRGLRWVHGGLTAIDRDWIVKTAREQRCVVAEPRRDVVADVALEYVDGRFFGYSYFKTGSGVYKENIAWPDERIEAEFSLLPVREKVERWLEENVWPRYRGPLGVDLMVDRQGQVFVSEINFRHTMGMVAHERIRTMKESPVGATEI